MNWKINGAVEEGSGVIVNLAVPKRKAVATPKLKVEGLRRHKPPTAVVYIFEQSWSDYTQHQKLILKPCGRNQAIMHRE
uniref:Uncharacterized protein n=1 Tax=Timema bartmani TaxID=61472 RepID=A0A7R9FD25_9NEOP|nr:unnamed protein product [Timema bartmani]